MKNKVGRPKITAKQKKEMLQKLEPYLKSGLSIRKALRITQIPNSTFYKIMKRDNEFREQIERFRQYLSVVLSTTVAKELFKIVQKQKREEKLKKKDIKFLCWFATHSNLTREEFDRREKINTFDPELEIQRIINMVHKICSSSIEK